MSRFLDREERPQDSEAPSGLSRSGGEQRPRAQADESKDFGENRRERFVFRDREYRLRPSEGASLRDLGTFRLIREDDLVRGVYTGNAQLAEADLRSLRRQGLVRSITFQSLGERPIRVHTLTGEGYYFALSRREGSPQFYYWGIVKPSEVKHDSLLYRAYLHEGRRIGELGGSLKRVLLDYELKRELYSRLNKPGVSYRKMQAESARELHLPVIDGHVVFPDFRLEHENERGEISRTDVEVSTENYRGKHIAAKLAAGFLVYSSSGGIGVQSGGRLKGQAFQQENRTVLPL